MNYNKRHVYDLQNIAIRVEEDLSMLSNQIDTCLEDNTDEMQKSYLTVVKDEYRHVEHYFEKVQKLIDATITYMNNGKLHTE